MIGGAGKALIGLPDLGFGPQRPFVVARARTPRGW